MKKIILSIGVLLALAKIGSAKPVPVEKAQAMAQSFWGSFSSQLNKSTNSDLNFIYSDVEGSRTSSQPAYYIFANPAGAGFVVVAGDDVLEPILGYSYENSINTKELPPNFKELLNSYKKQVSYVRTNNVQATTEVANAWEAKEKSAGVMAVYPVVAPLIKTRWGQGDPYNGMCPGGSVTGCVATAMAQIMYYWMYPGTGQGSHSYKPANYPTQTANFEATNYSWGYMRTTYSAANTATEKNAVAQLMYHCGVSVDMGYSPTGSGAVTAKTVDSYVDYFRYSNITAYEKSGDYTASAWINLLKSELNIFRPMQMRGDNHSWVCDGYNTDDAFHMNWGWNGSSDGYFKLADVSFPNLAVVKGIEKPSRRTISDITSSLTTVCGTKSFTCSVTSSPTFITYLWTVPAGWSVSGVVSTGQAISGSNSVTIATPANYSPAGGDIAIKASAIAASGERTPEKQIFIGTGAPTVSRYALMMPGTSQHVFKASGGAIIQYSSNNSSWTSAGNTYTVAVTFPQQKIIYIRASNSCKTTTGVKCTLTSLPPGAPETVTGIEEEASRELSVVLAPNPATDYIAIDANKKIKTVGCVNYLGQPVGVELIGNKINISELSKGMYILNIVSESNEVVVQKFIKE